MRMGSFIYGKSLYHRMDVRAKVLFSLLFSIALILSSSLYAAFTMMVLTMTLSFYSVGGKETMGNFKRIGVLVLFIILFSPLQKREGQALIEIGTFMLVSVEGAISSALILFKFIGISLIFSLLLETERIESIIMALRYFKIPYSVSLTVSMTLSFIPALIYRYSEIREAIELRMNDEGKKDGLMATLVSLIVSAVKMIPESASILEERGFTGKSVESYRALGMNACIFTQILLSVIIPIAFILWR